MHKIIFIAIVFFSTGFITGWYTKTTKFKFKSEIPTFSQPQKEILKNSIPELAANLESFESYFISNVVEKDSTIEIYLLPLISLREGYESRSGTASILLHREKRAILTKNFKIVKQQK